MSVNISKLAHNKFYLSLFLLTVIYLVGIVTILLGHAESLMPLTPYNLVFASALILYNAQGINKAYLFWFALIALVGFFLEWAGITTGLIFGSYAYGNGLGIKMLDVPLIIGVNWAVLVFSAAAILNKLKINHWLKAALGATIMVAYDFLLEPVAMRFDFWDWQGGNIPLQNYLAWWITAFLMSLGVLRYVSNRKNKIAPFVLAIQTLFFAVLILKEGISLF